MTMALNKKQIDIIKKFSSEIEDIEKVVRELKLLQEKYFSPINKYSR